MSPVSSILVRVCLHVFCGLQHVLTRSISYVTHRRWVQLTHHLTNTRPSTDKTTTCMPSTVINGTNNSSYYLLILYSSLTSQKSRPRFSHLLPQRDSVLGLTNWSTPFIMPSSPTYTRWALSRASHKVASDSPPTPDALFVSPPIVSTSCNISVVSSTHIYSILVQQRTIHATCPQHLQLPLSSPSFKQIDTSPHHFSPEPPNPLSLSIITALTASFLAHTSYTRLTRSARHGHCLHSCPGPADQTRPLAPQPAPPATNNGASARSSPE